MRKRHKSNKEYRVCASCEHIFVSQNPTCPKCDFASYDAVWVYGGIRRTRLKLEVQNYDNNTTLTGGTRGGKDS